MRVVSLLITLLAWLLAGCSGNESGGTGQRERSDPTHRQIQGKGDSPAEQISRAFERRGSNGDDRSR